MENRKKGRHPKNASQESLSGSFVNSLYTEVGAPFYRRDAGGVSIAGPRAQNGGNRPNRGSRSTGASPEGQFDYDRIHEPGKDLEPYHGACPVRVVSASFSQPTRGRCDAQQTRFHASPPDLGNINTGGRYNSGNPYLDWFGRRSDPLLCGGSMIRDPIINDIRDWAGPDQASSNVKDPVAPYFHGGVNLAPGANESISSEWTRSPTQSEKGLSNNADNIYPGVHDNDGWASDITHHEEGLETWRSAPKEAGGDSGEGSKGETVGDGCMQSQQSKDIERADTCDASTIGKNIQEDGNSEPGRWDWPTDNGDGNQVGGVPFTNPAAAGETQPDKKEGPEEFKCCEDQFDTGGVPNQVHGDSPRVSRPGSFSLDSSFKVEEPQNSPSDFSWKIENHPWPPIRPNGESSRQKDEESTKAKEGANPSWGSDYIEIDTFTPMVGQKEDFVAKNVHLNLRETVPPSRPRLVPNNTTHYPKEDLWAKTGYLDRPENLSPRRPFMALSDTAESSTEEQNTKTELARMSKELVSLKSTTRHTKKKIDKLASQLKKQKNAAEAADEATGDASYWEQDHCFSYTFPLWAILAGAFTCFCLGMIYASGSRGTPTCVFNGAA